MATKRRKIPPRRINEPTPLWAQRLLAGERPERDSAEDVEFFNWAFCGDPVPGLPPADSPEGYQLWSSATRADEA
jgi:hypothetical protein